MRSRDRADASRDCRSIMIGDPAPLRARSRAVGIPGAAGGSAVPKRRQARSRVARKRRNRWTVDSNWSTPHPGASLGPRGPITPPSLSCPSVKNVSLGPPRSGLGHRRGSPAGCITRPIRASRTPSTFDLRVRVLPLYSRAMLHASGLHALASPSREESAK